jgi:Holliday junction resolvase RusA-like endonuclease
MPAELILELPMPPTANNLFATDARSGRRFKTHEYREWIKEAGWRLAAQRPPLVRGKVSLLLEIEEPKTARRQDCTNRVKAVEDLLVSHRIIEGDCQKFVRTVTVRWAAVEGVRITIKALEA